MSEQEAGPSEVTVVIDGLSYRIRKAVMTATQVRAIPHPPIAADRDLWLELRDGSDRYLDQDDQVELTEGLRLYTAPRQILAGTLSHPATMMK